MGLGLGLGLGTGLGTGLGMGSGLGKGLDRRASAAIPRTSPGVKPRRHLSPLLTSEPWYSAPGVSGTEYVPLKNVMGMSDESGYLHSRSAWFNDQKKKSVYKYVKFYIILCIGSERGGRLGCEGHIATNPCAVPVRCNPPAVTVTHHPV